MSRHWTHNMNGERYLGNVNTLEVHDLDNEQASCQVDEITAAGNDRPFGTLTEAHDDSYENCPRCIGGSIR